MTDTTTTRTLLPDPAAVGARAAEILAAVQGSELFARLERSARKYVDCWAAFTGHPRYLHRTGRRLGPNPHPRRPGLPHLARRQQRPPAPP